MELDLARLSMRHIRLIHGIGETGQISLAAARMGISQPAASRSLSEVEHLVGTPLFERQVRGMVPTPIGQVFLHRLDTIVGELTGTIESLDSFQKGQAGGVRIGSVTGPAISTIVPVVQALRAESPNADISIDVAPSVDLVYGLLRGEFDIVVGRIPQEVDPRQFVVRPGLTEEMRLVVRAGHPLLAEKDLTLDRVHAHTFVTQRTGSPIRTAVERAFLMASLAPPAQTVESASLEVMIAYIRRSDAIATVTTEVSDLICATTGHQLRELSVATPIVLDPYHLLIVRNRGLSPIGARVFDLLTRRLEGT